MRNLDEIRHLVCEPGDLGRDVTFTPVAGVDLCRFLESLLDMYQLTMACDSNGQDISPLLLGRSYGDFLFIPRGFIHLSLFSEGALLPKLGGFIDWPEKDGRFGFELNFNPGDIDRQSFQIREFMELIENWRSCLQAGDYFVRFENESWTYCDPMGLGVIYTGSELTAASID